MQKMHTRIIDSPVGPIRLTAQDGFLTGLYFGGDIDDAERDGVNDGVLDRAEAQLAAYFRGELKAFDLPVKQKGTPFQLAVWNALKDIPYGETVSYGDIARAIGRPKACRAVGSANHNNPISIIVPCHRVVGSTGTLTGYGGGLEAKRWLLELEQKWK